MNVPIGVSARHIHLNLEDLSVLFGKEYQLQVLRTLSQYGQYASTDTVRIVTAYAEFPTVRVVGPLRRKTQVEISRTDAIKLGIKPPVRISGDLRSTPGIRVIGPVGELMLNEGVIIPARHMHLPPDLAADLGVKERQMMSVKLGGVRPVVLDRVHARISSLFTAELHIDTDDANAAGVETGEYAEIVEIHPLMI